MESIANEENSNDKFNNLDKGDSREELSYSKNLYELSEDESSILIRKYMKKKPKITLHEYDEDEDEDEEERKEYDLKRKKSKVKNKQKRPKEDESDEE